MELEVQAVFSLKKNLTIDYRGIEKLPRMKDWAINFTGKNWISYGNLFLLGWDWDNIFWIKLSSTRPYVRDKAADAKGPSRQHEDETL